MAIMTWAIAEMTELMPRPIALKIEPCNLNKVVSELSMLKEMETDHYDLVREMGVVGFRYLSVVYSI